MKHTLLLLTCLLPALSFAQAIPSARYEVHGAQAKQIFDLFSDKGVGPGCAMGRCQTNLMQLTCQLQHDGAGHLQHVCSYLDLDRNTEESFGDEAALKMIAHMGLAGIPLNQEMAGIVYTSMYEAVCDYLSAMPEMGRAESTTCVFTEME